MYDVIFIIDDDATFQMILRGVEVPDEIRNIFAIATGIDDPHFSNASECTCTCADCIDSTPKVSHASSMWLSVTEHLDQFVNLTSCSGLNVLVIPETSYIQLLETFFAKKSSIYKPDDNIKLQDDLFEELFVSGIERFIEKFELSLEWR